MSYNNSFILCIISITKIASKGFFEVVSLAMKYNIYIESCTY